MWFPGQPAMVTAARMVIISMAKSACGKLIAGFDFLRKRLEKARIVNPSDQPNKDKVFFGATVTYENSREEEVTIQIVGEDEADSLNGKISWISPVARALMKAEEGDLVLVRTPAGEDELEVISIRYTS